MPCSLVTCFQTFSILNLIYIIFSWLHCFFSPLLLPLHFFSTLFILVCLLYHFFPALTLLFILIFPLSIVPPFVPHHITYSIPPLIFIYHLCLHYSPPLQGLGGDDRRGTKHTNPPQWGSSSSPLCKWIDGHLLQGPFHCRLGHGLTYWHQPTSCPCGASGCCKRGWFWRQIYCICLRGPHHQGIIQIA